MHIWCVQEYLLTIPCLSHYQREVHFFPTPAFHFILGITHSQPRATHNPLKHAHVLHSIKFPLRAIPRSPLLQEQLLVLNSLLDRQSHPAVNAHMVYFHVRHDPWDVLHLVARFELNACSGSYTLGT
jgi:hypothetical protein